MTRNQIEYYKAKTSAKELEETKRHNVQNESIALLNYGIASRQQDEIERHNLIVENQAVRSLDIAATQAAASVLGAQASMAGAAAAMASAQAAQMNAETNRQLLPYQQETEAAHARLYNSQSEYQRTQASGQRIINQYQSDLLTSQIGGNQARANADSARATLNLAQANNIPVQNALTQQSIDNQWNAALLGSSAKIIGDLSSATIDAYKIASDNGG